MSSASADPLVVAKSDLRLRALRWGSAGVAIAGVGHLAAGRIGGQAGHVVAGAAVVGAGAMLGWLASGAGTARLALVLAADALHDHASGASVGRLPWTEVTDVSVISLPGSQVVQLQVRDEAALVERLPAASRLIVRSNRRWLGAPVNLPVAACAIDASTLVAAIEQRVRRVC